MPTPEEHAAQRRRLAKTTAAAAAARWQQVDPDNIARSWTAQLPAVTAMLTAAQFSAADAAEGYLDSFAPPADVAVQAAAFAGAASDGATLASLLYQPAITALMAIGSGATVPRALAGGRANLDMIVRTQVADAGRAADQAALTARTQVQGYVRQIVGATCARCTILAGRFYRWNAGFLRHPRCDCIHIPADRAQWREAGRFHDPQQVYDSLSVAERQRAGWSLADQEAIADGADLIAVTNAKRGMYTAGGRKFTTEGTTVRGTFGGYRIDPNTGQLMRRAEPDLLRRPGQRVRSTRQERLTPDQIYKQAGNDRDEAVRLLRQNGYLRGTPAVRSVTPPVRTFEQRAAAALKGDDAIAAVPLTTAGGLPTPGSLTGVQREFPAGVLSDDERSFLRQYRGTAYSNINEVLRRQRGELPGTFGFDFYREATGAIDGALARSAIQSDLLVYRGVKSGRDIFGDAWDRPLTGAEWTEFAYISTTADLKVTRRFPGEAQRYLEPTKHATIHILVPRGIRGAGLSGSDYESEILLERGLRLRVVSDTGFGPNRVIEVEIVR